MIDSRTPATVRRLSRVQDSWKSADGSPSAAKPASPITPTQLPGPVQVRHALYMAFGVRLTWRSVDRGTKVKVDNLHYELSEEDLEVRQTRAGLAPSPEVNSCIRDSLVRLDESSSLS